MDFGSRFGGSRSWRSTPDVEVRLPRDVYHKMLAYARNSKGEISGFGKTRVKQRNGRTIITVLDVRIFKQVVNPVHTELNKEDLHSFYYELAKAGENPGRWNLWWHSHNDFAVFFSGTDTATISELSKESRLLSICINKKGDLASRYDVFDKEHETEIVIDQNLPAELLEACRKEVDEKVVYSNLFERKEYRNLLQFGPDFEMPGIDEDRPRIPASSPLPPIDDKPFEGIY